MKSTIAPKSAGRPVVPAHLLKRATFTTNRALEFFTESELRTQIGYGRKMWPAVIAKELIDNALDACETAGVSPIITIRLDADALTVSDNGAGLPTTTIQQSLDYTKRVSDKKHYISPTRGQLGNALKCVWAVPFVISGNSYGKVEVTSCGEHRVIEVRLNRVSQQPDINLASSPSVQSGTSIKVCWPEIACELTELEMLDLYNAPFQTILKSLVAGFAAMNPHAEFRLVGLVKACFLAAPAGNSGWVKWLANQPTSPHWYTPDELRSLLLAYIHEEVEGSRARTVREFVSEFEGLRRPPTQKQVTEAFGRTGTLQSLLVENDIPLPVVEKLLESMKKFSRPVKPQRLGGLIGKDHIQKVLAQFDIAAERIEYQKIQAVGLDGLPHVLEVAFGLRADKSSKRVLLIGLNHSPTFQIPTGTISEVLNNSRVQKTDPVVLFIHQVAPKFAFTGHGKGTLDEWTVSPTGVSND
jgi:DNA topoisomerase VI subunit B